MSKSWADLIPNQTPCSYDKWRAAETEASKYMMRAQATEDMRVETIRAICGFATEMGMYSGNFRAPTKGEFQALCRKLGWDVPESCKSRMTPADIEAAIASEHYFTAEDGARMSSYGNHPIHNLDTGSLGLLTFCVLVLRNGRTATGVSEESSAWNFDAKVSKSIARAKAEEKAMTLINLPPKVQFSH